MPPPGPLVPSLTIWTRLEPVPLTSRLEASLAAPLADPLWLLTRQWQFGELAGDDAGSPIDVIVETENAPLSRARLGDATAPARRYRPGELPLEAIVEAEPVRARDGRLAGEAGLHFLRLLGPQPPAVTRAYADHYAIALPQPDDAVADPVGNEAAFLLGGRAPDGRRLAADLRPFVRPDGTLSDLPAQPEIPPGQRNRVRAVGQAWLAWYDALVVEPATGAAGARSAPRAWDTARLEYRFAASAAQTGGDTTLGAAEYSDGELDWPDVDVLAPTGLGDGGPGPPPRPRQHRLLPTPVRFAGMPARRHWEIEDSAISFAGLEAGLTDLGRVLLAEFSLVYGEDWFVVPLDVGIGELVELTEVTVVDTFGIASVVPPTPRRLPGGGAAATRPWAVAQPAAADTVPDRLRRSLLVLPTPSRSLVGPPLEEVAFFRDEMANLVWAVERTVTSPAGTRVDATRTAAATSPEPPAAPDGVTLSYRLASPLPPNWVPYAAVQVPGQAPGVTRFERVALVPPAGRIASESDVIEEEEITATGVVVERAWQLARWVDGRTVLWLGRRKRPGRGQGASGLAWDRAEPV